MRLLQFALDRLKPPLAMDVDDPCCQWDYIEELYRRSGEIFMHEGEDPEDYQGYLVNAVMELKDLVRRGQVLVAKDPLWSRERASFSTPMRIDALGCEELAQCIWQYSCIAELELINCP